MALYWLSVKKRKNVLCVCAHGKNRSRYLAEYLRKKGYSTKYGGVNCGKCEDCNLLMKEEVEWADIIIIARKNLVSRFRQMYHPKGKKLIVLDVTDSRKVASDKKHDFLKMEYPMFKEDYVEPHLRKAIKPYLPL